MTENRKVMVNFKSIKVQLELQDSDKSRFIYDISIP